MLFTGFIDFMLKEKRLLECTNIIVISYQNNIKIFSIDSKQVKMIKIYCIICSKYRKFKNPRILYILLKKIRSFYCLQ